MATAVGDLDIPEQYTRPSTVLPVLLVLIGAYLAWFSVKYWRGAGPAAWPSYPIKSVLQGKGLGAPEPATTADVTLASYEQAAAGPASGGATGRSASGQAIAADALRYKGAPYVWGGAKPSGWDCSGFVNYVIGHDLGMTIPGG